MTDLNVDYEFVNKRGQVLFSTKCADKSDSELLQSFIASLKVPEIKDCSFGVIEYENIHFKNMTFSRVNLGYTSFQDCVFDDCVFNECVFTGVHFEHAEFNRLVIKNSRFSHQKYNRCSFDGLVVNQEHIRRRTCSDVKDLVNLDSKRLNLEN